MKALSVGFLGLEKWSVTTLLIMYESIAQVSWLWGGSAILAELCPHWALGRFAAQLQA
jgi:hypothetical protein